MPQHYQDDQVDEAPMFYDTDCGNKMTLATAVEGSSLRYSILRSMAPRFAENANNVPFGAYNLDTGSKKSLEAVSRDSRVFYASSFQSSVPRFGRSWSADVSDHIYDVNKTSNSKPSCISESIDKTSIRYAIHHSKQKRFNDKPLTEAPDVVYEVDYGGKESLATSMKNSPIHYRNLAAGSKRGSGSNKHQPYADHVGPGAYDFPYQGDATKSALLENRPLSTIISRTPRFQEKKSGLGLGSTYRPENDAKEWHKSAQSISKAEYLRPQYLPKVYLRKQLEESTTATQSLKAKA